MKQSRASAKRESMSLGTIIGARAEPETRRVWILGQTLSPFATLAALDLDKRRLRSLRPAYQSISLVMIYTQPSLEDLNQRMERVAF